MNDRKEIEKDGEFLQYVRSFSMKKWQLLIILLATFIITAGCSEVEKDLESLKDKAGFASTAAEKFPPSAELQKAIEALPNQYEDKETGFSFKYPSNWGVLEKYDGGDVSIDRMNDAGERTGAYVYITIYNNSPTDAPSMNDKLFAVETDRQMTQDGWTDLKIEKVTKHEWKDGVWFITEYEGKSDGYKIYGQEYYWENEKGEIRIVGVSFYDQAELKIAQGEIDQIAYSLNPNF